MEIYKKLQQAREIIKGLPLKKAGQNKFSNYDYFTPEQINGLVHEAEKQTGLIHLFSMERTGDGLHGHLKIMDTESEEAVMFIQATDIPEIKATNVAQQIGGAVTYTLRYMLMTAFDIADNSLDFDAKDNREPERKVTPTANGTIPEKSKFPISEKSKFPISEKAFGQLCDKLRANPEPIDRGNLLAKTRAYYLPFNDEQEEIISQITDN